MADISSSEPLDNVPEDASNPKKRQRDETDAVAPQEAKNVEKDLGDELEDSADESEDKDLRPRPSKLPRFTSPEREGDIIAKRRMMKHSNLFIDKTKPVSGILFCCQQAQEMQAVSKMLPLFARYLHMYEQEKAGLPVDPVAKINVREIQDTRFAPYNTGVKGLAFLGINGIVPSEFLPFVFERMKKDKTMPKKSKVERVIPCDTIVTGRMHILIESLGPIVQKYFGGLKPIRYAVMFRARNNPYLEDKEAIIRDVAALVPPRHKVDLKTPELVLMIEVFKSAAAITVLDFYYKLHKLNLNLYVQAKETEVKQ